jgi:hypothetical protein
LRRPRSTYRVTHNASPRDKQLASSGPGCATDARGSFTLLFAMSAAAHPSSSMATAQRRRSGAEAAQKRRRSGAEVAQKRRRSGTAAQRRSGAGASAEDFRNNTETSDRFTFTFTCHLGKTNSHRSRTTWEAQSAAHTHPDTHAPHKNTDTTSNRQKGGPGWDECQGGEGEGPKGPARVHKPCPRECIEGAGRCAYALVPPRMVVATAPLQGGWAHRVPCAACCAGRAASPGRPAGSPPPTMPPTSETGPASDRGHAPKAKQASKQTNKTSLRQYRTVLTTRPSGGFSTLACVLISCHRHTS